MTKHFAFMGTVAFTLGWFVPMPYCILTAIVWGLWADVVSERLFGKRAE